MDVGIYRMTHTATITPGRVVNGRFRPTGEITDRAKRYRANKADATPKRRCFSCGAKNPRDRAHIDGNEANNHPNNLAPQCRSCNVLFANTLRKSGVGKKTRQYNPRNPNVPAIGAYVHSIQVLRGEEKGSVESAVKTIQATPPTVRHTYGKKLWEFRKTKYGPSGRKDGGRDNEVPF